MYELQAGKQECPTTHKNGRVCYLSTELFTEPILNASITYSSHVSSIAVRVMLLTAIKEMKVGKGTSVNAMFTYLRTMYKYDPMKNRNHIKKMLTKLIGEGLVEQVKGRGLAGSFKLGRNYKEKKKKPPSPVCIRILVHCPIKLVHSFNETFATSLDCG